MYFGVPGIKKKIDIIKNTVDILIKKKKDDILNFFFIWFNNREKKTINFCKHVCSSMRLCHITQCEERILKAYVSHMFDWKKIKSCGISFPRSMDVIQVRQFDNFCHLPKIRVV